MTRAFPFPLVLLLAACGSSSAPESILAEAGSDRNQSIESAVTVGPDGNEPVITLAPDGTIYIAALQHLYRSTDGGKTWTALAGPEIAATVLASDSSLAVDPSGRLYMSFDYPYAGSTAVCTSDDRGETFLCNPAVVPGGTDRMWVTAPGTEEAYVVTNEGLYETAFLTSTDGGLTWIPTQFGEGLLQPQTGPLLKKPGSSEVLEPVNTSPFSFYVFTPGATGTLLSDTRPTPLTRPFALPSAAFDSAGTLFTASEDELGQVLVARSADDARNWTVLPPIPHTKKGTAIFAWLAAGGPNHVGVIYYWTPDNVQADEDVNANWSVYWSETFDADAATPTWITTLVEENIHKGVTCIAASCSGSARFAGDFISAAIDSHDVAHLTWMRERPNLAVRYARIR